MVDQIIEVLIASCRRLRNTGWFYDTEHKRLYVKTAGDNHQKIEIVVQ